MKKKPKQKAIDKAFLGSDKHSLDDLKLQPWTPERIMHAQSLGLMWPSLGQEGRQQFVKTKVYPGASMDMSIFLYLSTLEPDQVDYATREEAKAFGIKRGLHDTESVEFWDTYNKFFEVQNEIRAAMTRPKGSPGEGNEEDEPGNG